VKAIIALQLGNCVPRKPIDTRLYYCLEARVSDHVLHSRINPLHASAITKIDQKQLF
jgi:hypothetical protein